jgi:hypothetical protein
MKRLTPFVIWVYLSKHKTVSCLIIESGHCESTTVLPSYQFHVSNGLYVVCIYLIIIFG